VNQTLDSPPFFQRGRNDESRHRRQVASVGVQVAPAAPSSNGVHFSPSQRVLEKKREMVMTAARERQNVQDTKGKRKLIRQLILFFQFTWFSCSS